MDWHLVVAVVAGVLTTFGSSAAVLIAGGRWVGRVEAVGERLEEIETRLARIPVIESELEHTKEELREHRARIESTRDLALRARLVSQHEGE